MSEPLVLGADVGGTSTRMVLATLDGRIVQVVRGGPGNPNAVGAAVAETRLREQLDRCLGPHRPESVLSVVVGMAGLSSITDVSSFVGRALPGIDPAAVRVVPDFVTAFASGTPELNGYVVVAGTGAGAMRIDAGVVSRRRDAWGWLLGDAGSGFWLGREAVRATLTTLERGPEVGPLGREVLRRTGSWDLASLLATTYAHPPIWLAELAPAVTGLAERDPQAARIVEGAAAALLEALMELDPEPGRVVVTTGSVLGPDSPVRRGLLRAIDRRLDQPVRSATDGLAGGLWLALARPAPAAADLSTDVDADVTADADTDTDTGGAGRPVLDPIFHARLVTATRAATPG